MTFFKHPNNRDGYLFIGISSRYWVIWMLKNYDLFLFDRGYPSKDMFDFLESKKLKYLMRVKINKFQPEFDKANEPDQIIKLTHKNKTLTLRIINVILPTGEIEKLVTNIIDADFTTEDFFRGIISF